jgi:RNA polymerase sigma-70 factor, ECF subfamily
VDTVTSETDRLDVEASLRGDEAAYERLVRRYEGEIAAQMWRYARDANTLRDLVQEVFVEAYHSLPGFKPRAPLLHWLRRIATRTGYRYWRTQARERRQWVPLEAWHDRVTAIDPNALSPSEAAEHVTALLERLPPRDRMVLTLEYIEECDTRTIAERLGWSQTLVKVQAHRARRKLRTMLEELGYRRQGHA